VGIVDGEGCPVPEFGDGVGSTVAGAESLLPHAATARAESKARATARAVVNLTATCSTPARRAGHELFSVSFKRRRRNLRPADASG
jgi:hypothetical protein